MHEMALAEGIRAIIEDQARAHGFDRVTRLRLEVGRFAGVEVSALEFCLEVVLQGSPAEAAVVEFLALPGTASCYDCGQVVEIADRFDPCPLCGGGRLVPLTGAEMRIKDMEVV